MSGSLEKVGGQTDTSHRKRELAFTLAFSFTLALVDCCHLIGWSWIIDGKWELEKFVEKMGRKQKACSKLNQVEGVSQEFFHCSKGLILCAYISKRTPTGTYSPGPYGSS